MGPSQPGLLNSRDSTLCPRRNVRLTQNHRAAPVSPTLPPLVVNTFVKRYQRGLQKCKTTGLSPLT